MTDRAAIEATRAAIEATRAADRAAIVIARPPRVSEGWLRALDALGGELTIDEWAQRIRCDPLDVHTARIWLALERSLGQHPARYFAATRAAGLRVLL